MLRPCLVGALGLPAGVDDLATAERLLERARADESDHAERDPTEQQCAPEVYRPDAVGFAITLVDGTHTRLRFRQVGEVFTPEFRVAKRDIPIEEGQTITSMAKRVLTHFLQGPRSRAMDEGARWQTLVALIGSL